jgi:hypothetical protein
MKFRLCLAAPLLMLVAACTTNDVERSAVATADGIAAGLCERSSACTTRDTSPRYGPQQQRVVEDAMRGRREPM